MGSFISLLTCVFLVTLVLCVSHMCTDMSKIAIREKKKTGQNGMEWNEERYHQNRIGFPNPVTYRKMVADDLAHACMCVFFK